MLLNSGCSTCRIKDTALETQRLHIQLILLETVGILKGYDICFERGGGFEKRLSWQTSIWSH